jgi:hypothetical protein
MPRIIKFVFEGIPEESGFSIFDKDNSESTHDYRRIQPGNTSFEFTIPDEWGTPFRVLRMSHWWIPRGYMPIGVDEDIIVFNGGDYYADVNRDELNEELNRKSVEKLIHSVIVSNNLDGRQKFFVSLTSLQSYFEYLIYGMLVQSGHISKTRFNHLRHHEKRIPIAFSTLNTDFFTDQIEICPGKEKLGSIIPNQTRFELERIFNEIRKLRNKVVHSWGHKDVGQQAIVDIFRELGEDINLNESDDEFYRDASFVCIRLYARCSSIKNQLSLFNEKEIVRLEREARGY